MAVDNSLMDMFVFETTQMIDQLEGVVIDSESNGISGNIDEIFRIMHTIKGSAAMMMFDDISHLAHSIEDLFFFLREKNPTNVDNARLTDLVLDGMDFIKNEIDKIQETGKSDAKSDNIREIISVFLEDLKKEHGIPGADSKSGAANNSVLAAAAGMAEEETQNAVRMKANKNQNSGDSLEMIADPFAEHEFISQDGYAYLIKIEFEKNCGMEHLRAFEFLNRLRNIASEIRHSPSDVEAEGALKIIQEKGITIALASELEYEDIVKYVQQTPLMKNYDVKFKVLKQETEDIPVQDATGNQTKPEGESTGTVSGWGSAPDSGKKAAMTKTGAPTGAPPTTTDSGNVGKQGIISVNISKLDKLMNLVGELVTSESMVSQNPDLNGLHLENFNKAARQLQKIINELQDVSMSVRMVPLSLTFQKMNRIVRDMCRKLGKEVNLEIIGEETEVDKNIIEHITNPLMHLIRNSVDHGIEMPEERVRVGKKRSGTVTLEAKNESGDVWIIVKDDGEGLSKDRIYKKAKENGITYKSREELTDKEINQFILAAGFSTNEAVTEYSGRGVGMDVVAKGLESVGGNVSIDSEEGKGTQISIKIPLTLAIMDGMIVNVGESSFVIPITSIKESFKVTEKYSIADVNGEDIIMIRGEPNPIIRLSDRFGLVCKAETYYDGIMILVENETKKVCLYVDAILGQRQVVVKPLPGYIKEVKGISGCTLLGDGSISLILDVAEFLN